MKNFTRSFLISNKRLSNEYENPNQVNEIMKRVMNQIMKLQHARYVLDIHEELKSLMYYRTRKRILLMKSEPLEDVIGN